ncbi:NADH-quinone oxidoreductase subunit C [Streptomyces armeniacus]|uniref:NADH-quinone oxidoreductase subunit C n=1 Tax=Streptomyces armeniacus TaxID=83291 RepID=A0A345XZ66_9ACTN|nr:NADH-quinone oxidoreductase subunit C [Streptomyces armeniacus]AXK36932.1 NADH-quinone oxidoreductase subunit C [Streptomyces armeniacus]
MSEPSEPSEPLETPGPAGAEEPAGAAGASESPESAETAETAEPQPQEPVGWLPRPADAIFGEGATAEEAYALLTVDVPPDRWIPALAAARDELGCTYFDWLSAVDEPGTGFRVCAHLAALPALRPAGGGAPVPLRRLVVRTTVPHEAPVLPTATGVYAGAAWHERETHEMFGVDFTDHPHLERLLLPDEFEGHPLRKDFVLAARVAKAWPGAKEPGESGHGGPKRRQMQPPGVPDPNEWGPLKGQLPPAPARPARGRAAAAGERPARRARTASAGSASQQQAPEAGADADAPAPPRRARRAGEGSASQRAAAPATSDEQQPAAPAPENTHTATHQLLSFDGGVRCV